MEAVKLTVKCSFGFALVFGIASLIFSAGDWHRFFVVLFMGFFIGAIAAPEIEPKVFSHAWLLQSGAGIAFGICLGFALHLAFESILASGVICGLIGWLSPYWVKHLQIP